MRVTVLGAGVIGLSCAWQLARAGAKVTLIDAHEPPTGASAAAAGWISATAYPRTSQLNNFLTRSKALYPQFVEALGVEVGFRRVGHLRVTAKVDGFKTDKALVDEMPEDIRQYAEKNLREDAQYRWNEGSCVVEPRLLLKALYEAALKAGVVFKKETVTSFDGIEADVIVVATGYTSGWLKELLGTQYRARPKKGEGIEIALPEGVNLPTVIDADDVYIVPRLLEKKAYIGTLDEWVDNTTLTATAPGVLLAAAARWVPGLKSAGIVGHFVGVRTVPLNEGPIIGQHNENKRIFMALGFAGGGFKAAPLAGQVITAQIMGDLMPKKALFSAEKSS